MDWVSLLLELAAQAPPPPRPMPLPTTADGFTTLEIILITACGTLFGALGTTAGVLFRWGNKIRDDNAQLLEKRNAEYTEMVRSMTADNKDVVHTLQSLTAQVTRLTDRQERDAQRGR